MPEVLFFSLPSRVFSGDMVEAVCLVFILTLPLLLKVAIASLWLCDLKLVEDYLTKLFKFFVRIMFNLRTTSISLFLPLCSA